MASPNKKQLEGIYHFMAESYKGNWIYRWGVTPYMEKANKTGKRESILAHQWGMMALWFQIRRICPKLNALVSTEKIYEVIINHDLGEIAEGDVSMFQQIQGLGANKVSVERREIERLTSKIPASTKKEIVSTFDKFEADLDKIQDLEFLVAKFLDGFQGNHFAITYGNDLSAHSAIISKISHRRFMAFGPRLMEVLKKKGYKAAAAEVQVVYDFHLSKMKEKGIILW